MDGGDWKQALAVVTEDGQWQLKTDSDDRNRWKLFKGVSKTDKRLWKRAVVIENEQNRYDGDGVEESEDGDDRRDNELSTAKHWRYSQLDRVDMNRRHFKTVLQ